MKHAFMISRTIVNCTLKVGESRPKRPRTERSTGKVMISTRHIIFIDYLEKEKTLTGEYWTLRSQKKNAVFAAEKKSCYVMIRH